MSKQFKGFSFEGFWDNSEYAKKEYVGAEITPKMLQKVEQELGYKLPTSYITLIQSQNGGIPKNTNFPTTKPTSWARNHIAITGIFGIDTTKRYSLLGYLGSEFRKAEWGYPDIGIYICDCPSAGHDMIALDYRKCGKNNEPEVVHVDHEYGYKITFLASNFESFIRGLEHDDVYDTSEEDLKDDLIKIKNGKFSDCLSSLIDSKKDFDFGKIIRNICKKLTTEKGHFLLHADELSYLMYDVQFLLYTESEVIQDIAEYLEIYPSIIPLGNADFSILGYDPSFVEEWINHRISNDQISYEPFDRLKFNKNYEVELFDKLKVYS